MTEIKSHLSYLKKLTAKISATNESLLEVKGIPPMSEHTNLNPNEQMKDVFNDSQRLTNNFCVCLRKDVKRVESIGQSFQERDEHIASQMNGGHHASKPI
ncbi:TIGR04197 family type VII secretion effector [Pueribacillus sp. YX66]|uniref:TIGR04197 family type VII secretion effector n=1 Tax=Pueribacillus sp. YX66 TaxID=3229242 RepID=UPI00358D753F